MNNSFIQIAKEKFHFLETKYGVPLEIISDNELKLNYNDYCLRVMYDNKRSYELDIRLNVKGSIFQSYEFHELAQYAGVASENSGFQASTKARLELIIDRMANLLSLVCNQIPLFSQETMTNLQKQREKDCRNYALKNKLVRMRVDAEKAWKEKNFAAVLSIYEPFLEHLSKAEIKKYEYAFKHLLQPYE